ncbi:hypothetical protein SCUCBS95973_007524 [Sporothrix curviconia]|uniref:Uncharacterized protein n=1 Tax=Sporothrix curviconia TaxID=1260050 RepID=A0ABP0CDY8_9PEZI
MELDWGGAGSGRNGMFSSRVKYTDGTFVYIYVDREEQEFGRVDLDELSGNSMGERYKQLCLMPRYDVFAFMRKKVDKKDGSFVIYKFDEMPKPAPVEVEEEDDSDDESRNGEGIGNGSDGDDDQDVDSRPQEYTADPVDEDAAGSHPTTDAVGSPRSDGMQDMDEQEDAPRSPAHSVTNASSVDGDPDPDVYFFFQPIHKGSFTTMAEANAKAIDTFTLLTRPRPPARMDAVFYYKHTLQPAIDEERRELLRDQDANDATQQADLSWKPSPQFGYDYEEINVTVTKSTLEGPLDLTGAF